MLGLLCLIAFKFIVQCRIFIKQWWYGLKSIVVQCCWTETVEVELTLFEKRSAQNLSSTLISRSFFFSSLELDDADAFSFPLLFLGQKTCLHLHGLFPYIYVPYDGFGQEADRYLRQVAYSIDRALNVSMGNPSSNVQHIFKVALVSGMYV